MKIQQANLHSIWRNSSILFLLLRNSGNQVSSWLSLSFWNILVCLYGSRIFLFIFWNDWEKNFVIFLPNKNHHPLQTQKIRISFCWFSVFSWLLEIYSHVVTDRYSNSKLNSLFCENILIYADYSDWWRII